ncbi:MAG TPA: helix-turn-helix domain-containing protein [Frateuria sp.]|uniref:helix-turn-helix domain-containing protein n=1 Tax=Frateuria sp. TaxID=2211372 RepID=UPI002DF2E8FC|nr:helix-turn-helix domain-containing protein [Frateuria sp.]
MSASSASLCDEARAAAANVLPPQPAPAPFPTAVAGANPAGKATPAPAAPLLPAQAAAQDFTARIRLLIDRVGSTHALARCCGVSESTVRNWRDGHSDMSRGRCVALAEALDISLPWLVTGEGTMKADPHTDEAAAEARFPARFAGVRDTSRCRPWAIEPHQLAAALRLLQSYIRLAGGSLDSPQRAEVLSELYELLGRSGEPGHAERLIAFHATLGNFLRDHRRALIS